jgi:hypothetical protein
LLASGWRRLASNPVIPARSIEAPLLVFGAHLRRAIRLRYPGMRRQANPNSASALNRPKLGHKPTWTDKDADG